MNEGGLTSQQTMHSVPLGAGFKWLRFTALGMCTHTICKPSANLLSHITAGVDTWFAVAPPQAPPKPVSYEVISLVRSPALTALRQLYGLKFKQHVLLFKAWLC